MEGLKNSNFAEVWRRDNSLDFISSRVTFCGIIAKALGANQFSVITWQRYIQIYSGYHVNSPLLGWVNRCGNSFDFLLWLPIWDIGGN